MWNMNADELDVHNMREEGVNMIRLINQKNKYKFQYLHGADTVCHER